MEIYQNEAHPTLPKHQLSEIPEALRDIPQWMGTRFAPREDGKVDKPPYRVRPGEPIIKAAKTAWQDEDGEWQDNWTTYDEALAAYERGDVDAIGFVFTKDDPFFVVDCDHVINNETGEIHPAAAEVIHALGSYTERSCSGTGAHVIGYGTKPEYAGCKSQALGFEVEVYDSARFIVCTGDRLWREVGPKDRQDELLSLCRKLWPKRERLYTQRPAHPGPVDLEDQELLERARRSRTGARFRRLYDAGDASGYASASEADYALLNALIFWTAGDRERIIRLFEASSLYRRKDKHRDYVARSVDNALSSYAGSFYKPRRVGQVRQEDAPSASEATNPLTPYLSLLLDPSAWGGRKGASSYKVYTAAVIRASEDGIVDDDGTLRIGCDTRTLAEIAGTRQATVCESALPYLMQEMKLIGWRPGKGRRASTLVLLDPQNHVNRINKVSTHFIDTVSSDPEHALETLRLLIRMRRGRDKSTKLLRLGMPAMFVAIALASSLRRGQNIEELRERTGRSKADLRRVLKRLKAAGIAREASEDVYRLTDDFRAQYERELQQSGVTQVERSQRRQHEQDRECRDRAIPVDKRPTPLRGKDEVRRIMERRREALRQEAEERRAPKPSDAERIKRLVHQGMKPDWARAEVLGEES